MRRSIKRSLLPVSVLSARDNKRLRTTVVLWTMIYSPLVTHGQENKTFVAYSMNAAETQLQRDESQGVDWRKKRPELFFLGYITKPVALVVDRTSGDWILVGEHDEHLPLLTLDD